MSRKNEKTTMYKYMVEWAEEVFRSQTDVIEN